MSNKQDPELLQFMHDLELSLQQAQAGEFARVHTPTQIAARRKARNAMTAKPITANPPLAACHPARP